MIIGSIIVAAIIYRKFCPKGEACTDPLQQLYNKATSRGFKLPQFALGLLELQP